MKHRLGKTLPKITNLLRSSISASSYRIPKTHIKHKAIGAKKFTLSKEERKKREKEFKLLEIYKRKNMIIEADANNVFYIRY